MEQGSQVQSTEGPGIGLGSDLLRHGNRSSGDVATPVSGTRELPESPLSPVCHKVQQHCIETR